MEPEPLGPFVIKTRGRIGKKPAAQSEGGAQTPPLHGAEGKPTHGARPKVMTPLVLAGAIGGGGALVLGLLIALVCVLLMGRGKKPLAQDDKTQASAPLVAAVSSPATEDESNPQVAVVEKSAEASPAEPVLGGETAGANATASAKPDSKSRDSSAPAAGSSPPKVSPSDTVAASTPPVSAADAKKDAPPAKMEDKPAPKPEPPKPPAKPSAKPGSKAVAKPDAKSDPFKDLATAVSLPELPEKEGQPTGDALSPLVLGSCNVDDNAALAMTLIGGDVATRSSRQKFDLQARAGSNRDWDFMLTGPMPGAIAGLSAKDGSLVFQWTEEGIKQASVAKQLCNCAINLVAGTAKQVVALRTPVRGAPLVVEIDKPGIGVKWNVDDLPLAKQLFIEVTRTEAIKSHKQDPPRPVNVGEAITVWTGPTEKIVPLALKLMTSATARGIEVKLQPQAKLEGQDLRLYRKKEMAGLQSQIESELPFLSEQLEQAKRAQPTRSNPLKTAIDKKQIDERKASLVVEINQKMAMRDQLNYLVGWGDTFQTSAQIHFRVYIQAGDTKIDVLRTDDEPPRGKAK